MPHLSRCHAVYMSQRANCTATIILFLALTDTLFFAVQHTDVALTTTTTAHPFTLLPT